MSIRSLVTLLTAAPLLASCVGQEAAPFSSADSQSTLAQRLEGRTAGPPVECLPSFGGATQEVIDRDTILFEYGGTLYRQDATGYCYPTGGHQGYTLVTRGIARGGQLCNGDTARVVSTSGGFTAGSCTFNAFVPYRRP